MKDQQAMHRLNSLMIPQKFCADKGRSFRQDLTAVYILILACNHIVKLWWIKVKAREMAGL